MALGCSSASVHRLRYLETKDGVELRRFEALPSEDELTNQLDTMLQAAEDKSPGVDTEIKLYHTDLHENIWCTTLFATAVRGHERFYASGQDLVAEETGIHRGVGVPAQYNDRKLFCRNMAKYFINFEGDAPGKYP
jgi:hypothetical protein